MHMLFWIIVGIIAGALARHVIPGEGPGGWLGDLVIGLVGALFGGWLFTATIGHSYGGWIGSTLVALVGAVVLLWIIRAFTRR
ncbi:MAG TPA: GlsB/YeaQ/YmgE family stress response membrane protein [Candidatus Xenobia bacterium]